MNRPGGILDRMPASGNRYKQIYAVVSRIPRGRVATYGQVARLAGLAGQARLVGYALSALADGIRVPWHRVVNAQGRIGIRRDSSPMGIVQRLRLQHERVRFDASGRVSLDVFRWRPRPKKNLPSAARTNSHATNTRFQR